jgi:hypothetical protein
MSDETNETRGDLAEQSWPCDLASQLAEDLMDAFDVCTHSHARKPTDYEIAAVIRARLVKEGVTISPPPTSRKE